MAENLEKIVEEKARALVKEEKPTAVNDIIDDKLKHTENNDIDSAIDLEVTKLALKEEETQNVLTGEKQEELKNKAKARRVGAETETAKKETEKVIAEQEKQIAEMDKQISARRKEVEQLKADSDKAQAFYESNTDILKYIGIRSKKTLRTMQVLMIPATIIFVIVQLLLFPLTFCGFVLENIIDIIGNVCGSIKNNAIKIVTSILVVLLVTGVAFCAYFFGGKLIQGHLG